MKNNFELVWDMNVAFGNGGKLQSAAQHLERIRNQCKNIPHEYCELLVALGHDKQKVARALQAFEQIIASEAPDNSKFHMGKARDACADIHVFTYGGQAFIGCDGDADVKEVVSKVMTRFIKDEADKQATIALHAAKGVTDVYFEGEYPKMIMKSASDQPDAPVGKFLKSASTELPHFE